MDCYQSKQCDFLFLAVNSFLEIPNKEITTATISNKVLNKPNQNETFE
jgi:hypothetical protein